MSDLAMSWVLVASAVLVALAIALLAWREPNAKQKAVIKPQPRGSLPLSHHSSRNLVASKPSLATAESQQRSGRSAPDLPAAPVESKRSDQPPTVRAGSKAAQVQIQTTGFVSQDDKPTVRPDPVPGAPAPDVPRVQNDDDVDITLVTQVPAELLGMQNKFKQEAAKAAAKAKEVLAAKGNKDARPPETVRATPGQRPKPSASAEPDENVELEVEFEPETNTKDMLAEGPTGANALILVSGVARSDIGLRRKTNEDCYLLLPDEPIFAVADGMGGHAAGDMASGLAVDVLSKAFNTCEFDGPVNASHPRRADELVRAVRMANRTVFERAASEQRLAGMGTTLVAARFSQNKQRVYVVNVGDSRCYRIRNGVMHQLTDDHTVGAVLGITGRTASQLTRAIGVRPIVDVDLSIDEPQPDDYYLLCTDGLTKMMPDSDIRDIAIGGSDLEHNARHLIDEANARGGRDNVTVILIRVEHPLRDMAKKKARDADKAPEPEARVPSALDKHPAH